ncbi:hypothetical protein B566_EDAN009766 [Ephemera danica]|nr:hypothetical protein B566_EDAN009766 [Ephemera danica]
MAFSSRDDDAAPWNFSWVVRDELCAMARPRSPLELAFLVRNGVTQLVTLSREQRPPRAVGVHCRMGRGRTGVMAACYLVKFYEQPPERAVINIRLMRPGSVETYSQERAVVAYFDFLRHTSK